MKKIYYLSERQDPNIYEGRKKVVSILYSYLSKYYNIEILNDDKCIYGDKNVLHIHTSGIFQAIKYYNLAKKLRIVYSLYSNLKTNPINLLRDAIDIYFKYKAKNPKISLYQIKRIIMPIILSFIPWFVIRKILKNNEIVILPTKYLQRKLKLKNAKVIPIGIDTSKFCKKRIKRRRQKLTVGYVGHPSIDKGIMEVVKIFSRLSNSKFKKVLFLSNMNVNLDYFKKIDSNIEIHGPKKDLVMVYNSIDILVLPYRHEVSSIAIPLVLIEGMACGVPIITSDLPHIREIGRDALIYVKPFNIDKFVEEINKLAQNPKRREEMGEKARKIVERYYSKEKMLREYKKIYDSLLKS